jgi:hypothetical protein
MVRHRHLGDIAIKRDARTSRHGHLFHPVGHISDPSVGDCGVERMSNYTPLRIEQDCDLGIVTIEDVKYAFHLFQTFGIAEEVGSVLCIVKREDGVLTIRRLHHLKVAK